MIQQPTPCPGCAGANHCDPMPETIATRWGASREPDAFAPKSAGIVFMQLFIGTGTVAFLALLSWFIGRTMEPKPGE